MSYKNPRPKGAHPRSKVMRRKNKTPLLILSAGVILLAGCAFYKYENSVLPADELPSVTDYISEARSVRSYETDADEFVTAAVFTTTEPETETEQLSAVTDESLSETESETETSPETEETEPAEETTSETTVIETEAPETLTSPRTVSSAETIELETECSVPAAQSPAPNNVYDSDFFSSDLFIGDSISTGYSLYGFLNDKNVFAKVGLNPSTVLSKAVVTCYGEIGVCTMLSYTMPDRVYIMLGSNGIQWLSVGNMLQSTDTLVGLIKETCPDSEVVIISVPPVTPKYNNSVDNVDVMAKINEYNTSLSAYCSANKMLFVDIASVLKDETGYFNTTYAESDGMHFKSAAYKVVLSKIQSDVESFFADKAETETAPVTEETVPETVSETEPVTTEASITETTVPETFMTLPSEEAETLSYGKKPKTRK